MSAKKKFHMTDLEEMIALLGTQINPQLTVIDGIYGMEKGPASLGQAHRMDVIMASRDVFSCDMVGAAVLGIEPQTVDYLRRFAQLCGRPIEIESVPVKGEPIESVRRPLAWEIDFEDFFRQAGIEGVTMQWPGMRYCTNCVSCAEILVASFCKDNRGVTIDPIEFCFGEEVKAREDSQKVILFGDCAIRANMDNGRAVKVEGCPPKVVDSMVAMINTTLDKKRARKNLSVRMMKGMLNKIGIYHEFYPREFSYDLPDFDPAHF